MEERERERQRHRETDRQTDRQTERYLCMLTLLHRAVITPAALGETGKAAVTTPTRSGLHTHSYVTPAFKRAVSDDRNNPVCVCVSLRQNPTVTGINL